MHLLAELIETLPAVNLKELTLNPKALRARTSLLPSTITGILLLSSKRALSNSSRASSLILDD
jgi:hypothetical protein